MLPKSARILQVLLLEDRKMTAKEIAEQVGMDETGITAHTNRLTRQIKKQKIDGKNYFFILPYNRKDAEWKMKRYKRLYEE